MPFQLTSKQERANRLLGSDATHNMLYGGSRSGKTFVLVRAVLLRALAKVSRHAALRFRFNAIKQAVVMDTLPKVMELCWPGLAKKCHLDKQDWFYALPVNGKWSEVWFGGLDDKERTEKILGKEFSTVYLNECSQIPWASRNMVVTRLAENSGLSNKLYYDCNPPSKAHWTYKVFVEKKDPNTGALLKNPDNFISLLMNPEDNKVNLPPGYIEELNNLPERERMRFLLGLFGELNAGALWYPELIEQQRILDSAKLPQMQRIIVAVDPSGCSGPEDTRSDEIGIVVVGLGTDGKAYVLEDLSGRMSAAEWPKTVVAAFDRHKADRVVGETNFGGDMVRQVIQAVRSNIPFSCVNASRGKHVRADPIATLFEQEKVYMVGFFAALEEQLCAMTTSGYLGSKSPDRADAMVWGITELFPTVTKRDESIINLPPPNVIMSHPSARRRR